MVKNRTDLNEKEVGKLLRGPEVVADLRRRTRAIAAAAGPGMVPSVVVGRTRARGSVITGNQAARAAEARDRALTRALDAGRA